MTIYYTPLSKEDTQETEFGAGNQDILLTALSDRVCRRILGATTEQALTANELSERLDLPLSTTYRKLDLLCETTTIQQSCRLVGGGHHATQYRCTLGQIHISLSVSDGALLSVIQTNGTERNTTDTPTKLRDD